MKKRELTRKQKISHLVIFALVLFLVLESLSLLLVYGASDKDRVNNFNPRGIYMEQKDTIDVVAMGSSNYYSGLQPHTIWEEHGIPSFVWGESAQRIYEMTNNLRKIFRYQSPEVVLLEPNMIYRDTSSMAALNQKLKSYVSDVVPLFTLHINWKMLSPLKWDDWTFDRVCYSHGYRARFSVNAYTGGDWMKPTNEKMDVNPIAEKEFRKCIRLCKKNGAKVVIMPIPGPKEWNMARHNRVQEIADEEGAELLDLNLHMKEIGLDWKKDTVDNGYHLNIWGAEKVSRYVGDYLNSKFRMEDRRNDARYRQYQQENDIYLDALRERMKPLDKGKK